MSATAVADLDGATVRAEVDIAAPPERVFRALTEPDQLAAWWGAPDFYRTFDWSVDLRPGGQWSCKARTAADHLSTLRGEYQVVEATGRLHYTWQASWEEFEPSTVTIDIEPSAGGGSRVALVHRGGCRAAASYTGMAEGWQRVLDWLSAHAAS